MASELFRTNVKALGNMIGTITVNVTAFRDEIVPDHKRRCWCAHAILDIHRVQPRQYFIHAFLCTWNQRQNAGADTKGTAPFVETRTWE